MAARIIDRRATEMYKTSSIEETNSIHLIIHFHAAAWYYFKVLSDVMTFAGFLRFISVSRRIKCNL